MSTNNNNFTGNTTAASPSAMAERLAFYESSCKRAAKRIEKKQAIIKTLEDEVATPDKQLSDTKHAPSLDKQRIDALAKEIKDKRTEIDTQKHRHNQLCKDYQKLIDMKNGSEAELMAKIGQMMQEGPESGGSDGENEDGDAA
jgi:chromosome segregation ATPase